MPADYSKVHRLLLEIMLMQQGNAGNADDLAQRCDVEVRTIYRDLKVISDLSIPYFFDEEARTYRIRKDFFLPPVHMTAPESLALVALAGQIAGQDQIAMTSPAASAIEKLRSQLPESVLGEVEGLEPHIEIRLPATGPDEGAVKDVFTVMQGAIRRSVEVVCTYESATTDSDNGGEAFRLRPYALSFDQRAWYVVGHHSGRDAVRRLKLNRFTEARPTETAFTRPENFSLTSFRGNAWRMIRGETTYAVEILFDATVADAVSETTWHRTQEIEEHEDGSLTFRCTVDGLDEIVWWVLGYGPHAKVKQPDDLVERLRDLAERTAEQYRS
ncbi:helix-turn-helix transcriptional regulator [Mucisphaera calidilacus]|uniref:Transcriptional regulator n=1 Tax=Mucisphaera calidilacus TaxID=2527982 RepID=A0A518C086_9BACT|nr:WYL domain-containing protein [Mucisphaera calidilacus]QDU72629.1 hypothetical protein Pan265_25010 [Mucisphaera calidilacus]